MKNGIRMKLMLSRKIANLVLSALAILLFLFADTAFEAARGGLRVCAFTVIPSLFPYMVLSGLIVRRRLLAPLERFIPMERLFSLPRSTASPFLLGCLCGFPIGAKAVCELYSMGVLTKREAEGACAVSNNTGPAFAVAAAGGILWKSTAFGWYLYGAQLLSVVMVGFLLREKRDFTEKDLRVVSHDKAEGESPIRSFADSVSSAAASVVPLCGYIVFFSVLCAMAKGILSNGLPAAMVCALLEFTSGIGEAAALGGVLGRVLTGFSLGFSGISVFVQAYSFTSQCGLSLRRTFLFKGLQGLLCGALCGLYPFFFG